MKKIRPNVSGWHFESPDRESTEAFQESRHRFLSHARDQSCSSDVLLEGALRWIGSGFSRKPVGKSMVFGAAT